jgi:PEP-CTERM motif-containing protein
MSKRFLATAAAVAAASVAMADQTLSVDIYGAGDGTTLENDPTLIVVDVLTDVSTGDSWTAGGFRGVASGGASLVYALDPNTQQPDLTDPGTNNRFVTFFNKPRGRDLNGRFTNGGAEAAGRYCPTGPTATTELTEVNVAFFASPPETIGSPTVDGAMFRAAIRLPAGILDNQVAIWVGNDPPPTHPNILFRSFCDNPGQGGSVGATFDNPTVLGGNWGLSAIPEPASLALLALGGLLAIRRR